MRAGQIDLLDLQLPLVIRPFTRMTDEELIRFSEQNKPYRFERSKEGEIVVMTPVGGIGSKHEALVATALYQWNESVETGIAFISNAGFNLADGSCLSPDAAWLSIDRWNRLTHEQQAGYPPLCPEFVIEVRSQSDPRRMVEAKMQTWLENGAQLAWMIDPLKGDVSIYRPNASVESLVRPDVIVGTGPVAGFELRARRLWSAQ